MMGGFQCSKNTLIALNIFYIIVGIILISLGTKWSNTNQVTSLPIIGGIVACGVFLIIISIAGLFAALRHHQVLLFFYMVILFIVFLIQFSVACACLGVSEESQIQFARTGWNNLDLGSQTAIQNGMKCCGFETSNSTHPSCIHIAECVIIRETHTNCTENGGDCCSTGSMSECYCPNCEKEVLPLIDQAFQVVGGVSLFFSFTEIIGAFLAYRYRNLYAGSLV